jgi:deoxyribodipyrimidine photolyase
VFVWAPEEEGQFQPGRCSRWWLKQSLGQFQQQLRGLGSDLVVREGVESADVLLQLARETGASALFFNHLYDPISLVRDHEVKQRLTEGGVECRSYNAGARRRPLALRLAPPPGSRPTAAARPAVARHVGPPVLHHLQAPARPPPTNGAQPP